MEYVCLILQIIFILGIFLFKTNDRYLVKYNEYYKKYLKANPLANDYFDIKYRLQGITRREEKRTNNLKLV